MKRFFIYSTIIVFIACNPNKGKEPKATNVDTGYVDITELQHDSLRQAQDTLTALKLNKDSVLMALTKDVLVVIKNKQYSKLDSFIHPADGIRFSPYATIDPEADKKFTKEDYHKLVTTNRNKKINWGSYDGSGEPIFLTVAEYFKTFVYDANFVSAEKTGVNKVYQTGNSINNIRSFYKGYDFTDSYFSGSKKSGGMDWKAVRLVFKLSNGRYYLIGIVHDQWTI